MYTKINFLIFSLLVVLISSCGGDASKKSESKKPFTVSKPVPASEQVDLKNEGVGDIHGLSLSEAVDQTMVAKGEEIFKLKCTACHKTDKKFIGPSLQGVTERRSPSWIMNMMLNPEKMIKEDPLAKKLLMEHNGSPMANQNLTKEEARAILEYFRTLK